MKEVYVLRHGERDDTGNLTELGKKVAQQLSTLLPQFSVVISSNVPRTIETATVLAGIEPIIDDRAGYYNTTQEVSGDISKIATEQSLTFLEAAYLYNDGQLVDGIQAQAAALNALVGETLASLHNDEKALVMSHDMTMTPAMILQDHRPSSINYLSGYIMKDDGTLSLFEADDVMNPAE